MCIQTTTKLGKNHQKKIVHSLRVQILLNHGVKWKRFLLLSCDKHATTMWQELFRFLPMILNKWSRKRKSSGRNIKICQHRKIMINFSNSIIRLNSFRENTRVWRSNCRLFQIKFQEILELCFLAKTQKIVSNWAFCWWNIYYQP